MNKIDVFFIKNVVIILQFKFKLKFIFVFFISLRFIQKSITVILPLYGMAA